MMLTISKLIRAQYAKNQIAFLSKNSRSSNVYELSIIAREYFETVLTEIDNNGKVSSACGTYITAIFTDILTETGIDYTQRGHANFRKRLIVGCLHYDSARGKEWKPQRDKQETICKYLGCSSWQELCEDAEKLLKDAEDYLSDVASGRITLKVADRLLSPDSVKVGKVLQIAFKHGSVKLLCCGKCDFKVIKSYDCALDVNDIVHISDRICIGNCLIADIMKSAIGHWEDIYVSPSALKSFSIVNNHTNYIFNY